MIKFHCKFTCRGFPLQKAMKRFHKSVKAFHTFLLHVTLLPNFAADHRYTDHPHCNDKS
nr:MAG TPA: hypothetical protein [Caudoviricetes sp.]